MTKKLYHGAAFYPELWDEKTIDEDIRLMQETGINVVRIGEFVWSKIEPEEGKIDVSFFVDIITKLYENGIETVMCTPTPTPPIWMSHGHPERMYVDRNGQTMVHGSRQHVCTNNRYFRERAAIIIEEIAKAVGHLPGLIGWQLDNEFKCHVSECMCETCKELWHQWLEERYGTIDELNKAWGTDIWSEAYLSFDQVPQPGPAPFLHNSSLLTMYQIFSRDKITEFAEEQMAIIRKYSKAPITHNSSIHFAVDKEQLFRNMDFASFDSYATSDNYEMYLFNCDLWRNLKKDREFWVMETSPSYAASIASSATPHPNGYLKAEAVLAYALGGEAFVYWLWRQQRSGCEQPHSSVISAWGKPTLGYQNVLEVEKARKEIESVITSTKAAQAEVAITYSDLANVFMKTEPLRDYKYNELVSDFYKTIVKSGIHRDLIPEGASLDGYKILFSPFMHYLSDEYIDRAVEFVNNGGVWIVGPITGDRTENHTVHTDYGLGRLDNLAGVETLYTFTIDGTNSYGDAFGTRAPLGLWSSVYKAKEAKSIGIVRGGVTPGASFITERNLGKGKIVLLGSLPMDEEGEQMLLNLLNHYANETNVTQRTDATIGTIVAPRKSEDKKVWVIVNMDGNGGSVTLPEDGIDELTGEEVSKGKLFIDRYCYRVIRFKSIEEAVRKNF